MRRWPTALTRELEGFKYTFIKLAFKPNFRLSDAGPQGEDAIKAWKTTLHEIFFLGGGPPCWDGLRSETHWGRISGTQNEILIATGRAGPDMATLYPPPLISANGEPNVFLPLARFLITAPKIINVCWQFPLFSPTVERWNFACDLNLFHLPVTDGGKETDLVRWLDQATIIPVGHESGTDMESFNRGVLYSREGVARSLERDKDHDGLENKETYVHWTHWKNREVSESYKNHAQKNMGLGTSLPDDAYEIFISQKFALVERQDGVIREEIQVDFKRWMEIWAGDVEFAAEYPGSVPTHEPHGKDCHQCAPWAGYLENSWSRASTWPDFNNDPP
ncbi:uncharacterized protein JN550_005898 [Neoarthrinium moseri]|uniref:uncharacterized protein n=1 Tax=Neoarthrinium moseri TaxID=1658444 RepID=UPI001FDD7B7D|nr:uncharacterized protein JN550_005898 [Neoarthrinium moseri]KAI1869268.1 hypothetical protein JN550_005898 [Neoarthrinium moseri]